ncbi:hypothetical protein SAMN05421780_10682 [Flexibacter flexilis DSM 6793]|uniref:Uncharacterized protein n=1 Tax=Flexibacter flexilis DSM 6793 TaxID=927664 RepID=A0A1I1JY49_9BACT|nr:hypothetical protein SAMN05421780_10682 [Flexibacter flexilis DSM 6793]
MLDILRKKLAHSLCNATKYFGDFVGFVSLNSYRYKAIIQVLQKLVA